MKSFANRLTNGKRKNGFLSFITDVIGAAAVVGLSFAHFDVPVGAGNLSFFTVIYILAAGILSVYAMFLPGISGSTLLLGFGLYMPIITGLKNLMNFDFSSFLLLFVFGIGVLVGIFISLCGIRFVLDKNRSAVLYTVVGMMVGSLYSILQGPTTLKIPLPALTFSTFHLLWFAAGLLIVALFAAVKIISERRRSNA